jgi:hypothetical protein
MANIIIKKYDGYNRALGCHITSKSHYEKVMHQKGMCSFDEGMKLVEKANKDRIKPYDKPSEKAMDIIRTARLVGDKNGKIKCSENMIRAMEEVGLNFKKQDLPENSKQGGFYDEKVSQ